MTVHSPLARDRRPVRLIRQRLPDTDTASDVLASLAETPKRINPKYFYDEAGSRLFEQITALDEYYPTRTECRIYQRHAAEIAQACGQQRVVIEPGAGSCEKIRLLLDDIKPAGYVPSDISGTFLRSCASQLASEYPWLSVTAIQADFSHDLGLSDLLPEGPRTLFYPGSTLGNFTASQAQQFLCRARQLVAGDGNILIGLDMHKREDILHAAYNDRDGITAQFNLNVLAHLNDVFDGTFDLDGFRHEAVYNRDKRRIEMYLRALQDQHCELAGETIQLRKGERILTEYSHKYTPESVERLAGAAGLQVSDQWYDEQNWFGVFLLTPVH